MSGKDHVSTHKAFVIVATSMLLLLLTHSAYAGGGYFALGYGPLSRQMAGATTAVAGDAFAGASNPAKLTALNNRLDAGVELFNPHRKVDRTGSGTPFDFSADSKNSLYAIPELAYAHRINDQLSLGISMYANGGLNSEYVENTGIPNTNANPTQCGTAPGNFFLGCGKAGFDLAQIILAPTAAWKVTTKHSIGIAPLFALQRFSAFGLNAFAPTSLYPGNVTDRGNDYALGAGARIGWFGEMNEWLSLGAAYSSKIYMRDLDQYKGLFAEGSFDIPANASIGLALKPSATWLIAIDIQHIYFSEVKALGNSLLNSLTNPITNPLGSATGSGFGWQRNQTTYKLGLAYSPTQQLTLRGGFAYGKRPNDNDINAVSFSVLTPNPLRQASLGFTWKVDEKNEFHMAASRFIKATYAGPSALFPGATESVTPYVNTLSAAWSWHL